MRCLLLPLVACAATAGCAGPGPVEIHAAVPPGARSADMPAQACADRLAAARLIGLAHWHIYENCLKDQS